MSTLKPTKIRTGMPKKKMCICGMTRESIARPTSVRNTQNTAGATSTTPSENITPNCLDTAASGSEAMNAPGRFGHRRNKHFAQSRRRDGAHVQAGHDQGGQREHEQRAARGRDRDAV